MSTTHNIRKLLDIQDSNIVFEGNCVTDGTCKGKNCKYVDGKLTYESTHCKKGQMAFEYINDLTGEILDILDQRTSRGIKDHFIANYSLKDTKQVKTVTIDMNAGYVNVIKEMFPQAEIIIDHFHLVQLINPSMNKCRVRIMNTFNTSNGEDQKKYRRLKR